MTSRRNAMNVTRFAAAAVSAGLAALTVWTGVTGSETLPLVPVSSPVLASPPTGIGWSFEWDDDDDDWSNIATWECPAGCSITWEDDY